jgi:hypothetical protein
LETVVTGRAVTVRRNVEEDILDRLETHVAKGRPLPALPSPEGDRVNLLALCRALGLKAADAQHFYRKETVKKTVSALAAEQGLIGVGERGESLDFQETRIEDRIKEVNSRARRDAVAAEETSAALEALVDELHAAQAQIAVLREANRSLEERLRLVEEHGVLWDSGSIP